MDLFNTVMELFSSSSSPPINVANRQLNNNRVPTQSSNAMEPNNLSQTAAGVMTNLPAHTATASETTAATTQEINENLRLKLPNLSSSDSDSENEEPINPSAGTSKKNDTERTNSPPPNCAICLGRCKNKCFTDSCKHQFCFKCLCEWSKVKPECPLCKQTFKSIIHNVKSKDIFEEYHVQPHGAQIESHIPFHLGIFRTSRSGFDHYESGQRPFYDYDFDYGLPAPSRSSSSGGHRDSNQYIYRGELLDLYRQEYPGVIARDTLSQLWRRYIYDRNLYALPVADITGRYRESNARFYRNNPSQYHRLMPWINRDIVCLLRHTQYDVTAVLEMIRSILTVTNISSPTFRRRLQVYLGTKTEHFIHELSNFARSPYDMIGYDRAVQYSPLSNMEEVIEFTSSDASSDLELDLAIEEPRGSNNHASTSTSTTSTSTTSSDNSVATTTNAINLTIHNRLTSGSIASGNRALQPYVIDLREESNTSTTSTAQATTNSPNYPNPQNTGASENDLLISSQPAVSENIELTSGSSDECEFVLERKPPHLRTPEMVDINSDTDSDVVFVDESKPTNKTTFSSSDEGDEQNAVTNDRKEHYRRTNKIAALVEGKKRNHASNVVKSEEHDNPMEIYNLGASTSAALRMSIQRRADKLRQSKGETSTSIRLKRGHDNYSLRISGKQATKRRGKRHDSESSHSSTSSTTTTTSSSSSTSSSTLSPYTGDDFVASAPQRRRKSVGSSTSKVRKLRKRKANNYNDCSSEDDDDKWHMGKNFAVDRKKRKNQKTREQEEEKDQCDSEGENSWRLKAVNEPLRKQQQQQRNKKSHGHKRRRKLSPQQEQQQKHSQRRQSHQEKRENKLQNETLIETEIQNAPTSYYKSENTSSDESDNINLIQLKTKLAGQEQNREANIDETKINQNIETTKEAATTQHFENKIVTKNENNKIETTAIETISTEILENSTIPTTQTLYDTPSCSVPSQNTTTNNATTLALPSETASHNEESWTMAQNDFLNFSDDSNFNNHHNNNEHVNDEQNNSNSTNTFNNDEQLPSSSMHNYQESYQDNCQNEDQTYNDNNANNDLSENYIETLSTMPPATMNLNESNVFADGASMSTTTTDTILHDAAEQIPSATVNFYNPDENSTSSSSSSDSSMSVSTTSQSSSSSSSNTNSYVCYKSS